jgi:hypothetical protein
VNDEEIRKVAASTALARLTKLSLDDCAIGTGALAELVASPHIRGLTSLSLRKCGIRAEGVRVLADAPNLGQLTSLNLGHNQMSDIVPWSEESVLVAEGIGDTGAEALAESPYLELLQILRLSGCGIGDRGAHALAASRHLQRLSLLTLCENPFGEQARQALRDRFGDVLTL